MKNGIGMEINKGGNINAERPTTNYTKLVIRGSSISILMAIIAALISYITRIVMARNLGPSEYGLFYAVFTLIIFLLFFRDLGIGDALSKYIPEFRLQKDYDKIKTGIASVLFIQVIGSLILIIALYLLSDFLAVRYFKDPRASLMLNILLIYIIFSILFIILKSLFKGLQSFFLYSSIEFSKNLIFLILILFFFKINYGIFSPVVAYAMVCPILFLLYLPSALLKFNFFKYKVKEFKEISTKIISFGAPMFAASIGGNVIGYIDTIILTSLVSLSEVGVYNAVLPTALVLMLIGRSISAVVFPVSSELWFKGDMARLRKGIELVHKYLFIIIIPFALTIISFATPIIDLIFGKEYTSGVLAFQILIVGVTFYIVGSINNNIISGIGFPKESAKIIIIAAILNTVLNLLIIPLFGIEGAAVTTAISYLVVLILSTKILNTKIKQEFPKIIWLKFLICALIFISISLATKDILSSSLWIEAPITFIVATIPYAVVSYLLGLIDINEVKRYMGLLR